MISLLTACVAPSTISTPPTAPTPSAFFTEDFTANTRGWCADQMAAGYAALDAGEYVIHIKRVGFLLWCAIPSDFADVRVRVRARNAGKTADTAFGVLCHYQDDQHYYALGLTTDGAYTLRKYADGRDIVLAEAPVPAIPRAAEQYTLTAECAADSLVLSLNGQILASAQDNAFSHGQVGLWVWSGGGVPSEMRFDDFVTEALP
jgi:hypothetical protein